MSTYTNVTGVPLSVAVYLATDTYDHVPNSISVTSLLKPLRQIILRARVPSEMNVTDILSLVKSRTGTAIHDSIERAWKTNYRKALKRLGYPDSVIDRVKINPDPDTVTESDIPVYMELRTQREIMGYTITGKFDFVAEGRLEDFKSTTVFTWINGNKDEDHSLQGSLYRWLNPQIILEDHMAIQYIFTDWMPGRAAAEEKYPNKPMEQKLIPLLSIEDTEQYVKERLLQVKQLWNADETVLPLCNDKELWRNAPHYKYYKNPAKRLRSTKNFDSSADAYVRHAEDGKVGVVVEVPGMVIACKYCAAFPVCTQKDALIADGSLQLS